MYIKKWNDFIINENQQQSLKILRDLNINDTDPPYKLIKFLLRNNTSYLGLFTSFYYEQNVSYDDLEKLFDFLKSNLSNKLPKNPLKYSSYEELIDDVQNIKKDNNVKKVINELPSIQRSFLPNNIKENDELYDMLYEISLINNKGFFKKISKAHSLEDFKNLIEDYVSKYKNGSSYDSIISILENEFNNDQYELVLENEDDNKLVLLIKDYKVLKKLGSTNWCIVNSMSTYLSYIDSYNEFRHQYIIWNFNEEVGTRYYMIGITVSEKGKITHAHDYNDGDIKNNLNNILDQDILEVLKGPNKEYINLYNSKRDELEKQKRQAEIDAENERINNLRNSNAIKRENDEWRDDGYAQSLYNFLKEEDEIDIEEGEDIYDYIFELDYRHYNNGRIFEDINKKEWVIYDDDEATEAAIEYNEQLIDELGLAGLFGGNTDIWIDYVDGEEFSEYYIDEDYYREEWRDYGIEPDEDDEDIPNEEEMEDFINNMKEEMAEDPFDYLVNQHGYDNDSASEILQKFMKNGWKRNVSEDIVNIDGRENTLGGYDGIENESYYNGEYYYIYRLN